jgi:hypothetical protein
MFSPRVRTALIGAFGCVALGGCASYYNPYGYNGGYGYGGARYGYGYGGVSVGYGSGYSPYYGGYNSPYYGGYYSPGYYGYRNYPYGWNNGFYYPGRGIYVYDRHHRAYRWNQTQRRYWEGRRSNWNNHQVVVRERRDGSRVGRRDTQRGRGH